MKSIFGGSDESKKMQKYLLNQQFEKKFVSNSEGLHKGYDRFQSFLSQLETHGACVSTEYANQKFLRSLPSSWSQVSLIMRTKPGVDPLNFDDLYHNLRVFKTDVKGSTGSSSSTHNVAFVSSNNTSSTNEVNTAYLVSTSFGHNSQKEGSSSYTDDLMYSFFANQSSGPQLDHEDLEQFDEFDLKEMDLNGRLNIEKLDVNIVQKHGGSKQVGLKQLGSKQVGFKQLGHKQVGFKQLGLGVETEFHGVQDEKRVWFEMELHGAQGDREAEVFQVSNDDTAVAQRQLEDKQPEEKTNTGCLVKEQENVDLGIKVGANITVTGVSGQNGAEDNVGEKMKVKESMKANLRKLLK
nr:zinc finger, CCHC-type [Tanacetum cinerariifolium]